MKKISRKTANIITIIAIAIIVTVGVIFTGSIKGWFSESKPEDKSEAIAGLFRESISDIKKSASDAVRETEEKNPDDSQDESPENEPDIQKTYTTAEKYLGVVYLERGGVSVSLDEERELSDGDILRSSVTSGFVVEGEKLKVIANDNTTLELSDASEQSFRAVIQEGEIIVCEEADRDLKIDFGKNSAVISGCVAAIEVKEESESLKVLKGSVQIFNSDGENICEVEAGKYYTSHSDDYKIEELTPDLLDEFCLVELSDISKNTELCFTHDEIEASINREKEGSEQSDAAYEITGGGTLSKPEGEENKSTDVPKNPDNKENGTNDNVPHAPRKLTCAIEIRCDTILGNMDKLAPGKDAFVPSNGVILSSSTIEFTEGQTAFDILRTACSRAGISVESSYSPMFDSYYIEGINNIYQFDCGDESGWMYKINGIPADTGCSAYTVKNGDVFLWQYSCVGYGADI
ncbi:MAG: DUF4430 domain-containing protein [Lachnospiraceae bacterium]